MKGFVLCRVIGAAGEVLKELPLKGNLFLNEGADIVGRLLAGQTEYLVTTAYIEFQNGGTPPAITPTVDGGRLYYAGLEASGLGLNRDYLRVPLVFRPTVAGSDAQYQSNRVVFNVLSTGTTGVSGLPFSAEAESQVYGAALVATPDPSDRTMDLVLARFYPDEPLAKTPGGQVQLVWPYVVTP